MRQSIIDNPGLERDIADAVRVPNVRRLRRHVFVAYTEGGDKLANEMADDIADAIKESLLAFNPETGA